MGRCLIHPIYALFCGFLIGACDLVPGVSGGTMALILGIYEPLMGSIADLKKCNFQNFRLLAFVITGVGSSLLLFSSFFHTLLQDPEKSIYLYSLFFGLVGGSAWFVKKEIHQWTVKSFLFLAAGIVGAWAITNLPSLSLEFEGPLFYLWLVFSGSMAVLAMLLPGISGSYIMMILGPYPLVIENLARLSKGLQSGVVEWSSFKVLLPVACGIVLGAIFFSQFIAYVLKNFRTPTLSILLGFMIGASSSIWPFKDTAVDSTLFFAIIAMIVGVSFVLMLESIAVSNYRVKSVS